MSDGSRRDGGQPTARVRAIDLVRGVVMVLMTLDHASTTFNAGRVISDGAAMVRPGLVLEPMQFITRWVTHLCAPTFVLLAGVSLALSVTRRIAAGEAGARIDRDILIRGGLLIALDLGWMGWVWRLGLPIQLGVLYAIGASMIAMIALRRLPARAVAGLGLVVVVAGEAVGGMLDPTAALPAAMMTGGRIGWLLFLYPALPWAGFMMLGWAIGAWLARGGLPGPVTGTDRPRAAGLGARHWLALAAIAAVTFAIVRGGNGYGNAHLLRADGSWIEWLHVSKYPPSLSYAALELAIAFALLALTWRAARPWTPLVVLGQTALFFYLLHVHVFKAVAGALGLYKAAGLGTTYVASVILLVVLYPLCRWYLGVKQRHPDSVLRFI